MPFTNPDPSTLFLDESFQNWVTQSNKVHVRFWETWISQHPQHYDTVQEAARMVRLLHRGKEVFVADEEIDQAILLVSARIHVPASGTGGPSRTSPVPALALYWQRMAAVFIGLLIVSTMAYWYVAYFSSPFITYQTGDHTRHIQLPDGSSIVLNAYSSLRYPKEWQPDAPREVWLEGEAYFDVKHLTKPKRRFIVHANQLQVEVLGTTFNVWKRNNQTKVVLQTGKVELKGKALLETVLMIPGEMVVVDDAKPVYVRHQVNSDLHTSWVKNQFTFDATPMSEVALLIEARYGYTVQLADEAIRNEKLTYKPLSDDFELLLNVLEESFRVQVERNKKLIILEEN